MGGPIHVARDVEIACVCKYIVGIGASRSPKLQPTSDQNFWDVNHAKCRCPALIYTRLNIADVPGMRHLSTYDLNIPDLNIHNLNIHNRARHPKHARATRELFVRNRYRSQAAMVERLVAA